VVIVNEIGRKNEFHKFTTNFLQDRVTELHIGNAMSNAGKDLEIFCAATVEETSKEVRWQRIQNQF
jgi:hypothetical protein